MAQIIQNIMQSKVISNLDTYNHTTLEDGAYFVKCEINEIPPSGIAIAIKRNGSTIVSASVLAATQQVLSLQSVLPCVASDLISVVVSSSTPLIDGAANAFKGILNIHRGVS